MRGFVWDTVSHADPGNTAPSASEYANYWTESGSFNVGPFSQGINGLAPGQIYYCRACVHNSAGWAYGDEESFTTVSAGETAYNTMVGLPTSWLWEKCDYDGAEKCPVGAETGWAWEAPTPGGPDKTPRGGPTSFIFGAE